MVKLNWWYKRPRLIATIYKIGWVKLTANVRQALPVDNHAIKD